MSYKRDEEIHIRGGSRRGAWVDHSTGISMSRGPSLPSSSIWPFVCLFDDDYLALYSVHLHEVNNDIGALDSYEKKYRSFKVREVWKKYGVDEETGNDRFEFHDPEFLTENESKINAIISEFLDQISGEDPHYFFSYVSPRR